MHMIDSNIVKVRVKGDYACFTQPALKVERMTYPCMTPSAARGILECILWKPEFQWVVKSINFSPFLSLLLTLSITAILCFWHMFVDR